MTRVTIGVLSFNRLHYLKATLASARRCIETPDVEWIVSDNASEEPGLREVLQGLDWADVIVKRQTHAEAMNEIVARAKGDYLLLWPEDVQFTVQGDWMRDLVEILDAHPEVGSVGLDFQRGSTLRARLRPPVVESLKRMLLDVRRYGRPRRPQTLASTRGFRLRTYGFMSDGVCGSGIPSLTRTEVWRSLGPWRAKGSGAIEDSSLGAEADMIARFRASGRPLQMATPMIPVAADIITDPTGCKAKVRGAMRYGVYTPPPEGTFYYRIRRLEEMPSPPGGLPLDFKTGVEPLGFRIPVDAQGERLKAPINLAVAEPVVPPAYRG